MAAIVSKSLHYVSKVLKLYMGLGLAGALTVVLVAVFLEYPWAFKLSIIGVLWWAVYKMIVRESWFRSPRPPQVADRLLHWLLPPGQEAFLADLYEAYLRRTPYNSTFATNFKANLWFWRETLYLSRVFVSWRIRNLNANQQDSEFRDIMSFYRNA